jgi:glycosyltransferase involved in cell wall biosynthesis
MKSFSIIIPAYNEVENVPLLYAELIKHIDIDGYVFDLIFVDDGSTDGTLAEIKTLRKKDSRVKYISFSRNFGKEAAMHAGMQASRDKDGVIIIDCDLQQPPSLIPTMIGHHDEGYNIVYTKGRTRRNEPKMRTFFANWFYRLYNLYTERPLDNGAKDFQLLDRTVVRAFLKIKDNHRFVKGIFSWVGYKKKCIEFDFVPRKHGKSSWSFSSLLKYAFDGMNQFSRFLMIVPLFLVIGALLMVASSIALYVTDVITLSVFYLALLIDLGVGLFALFAYALFYLLYHMRREILRRPIYLTEEMSEDVHLE